MATKSILKSVNINNRKDARRLVAALEHAVEWRGADSPMQKNVSELKDKQEIRKFFEALE